MALSLPPTVYAVIVCCFVFHCLYWNPQPHPCINNPNWSSRITSSQPAHAHHLLPTMALERRGEPSATSSPKRKRRQCSACIKKWQVALQSTSSMAGGGKVKGPKIRIARWEGLLCDPCYNEKTMAITRNTEIEPLTSEQGRNWCNLKEKVKQHVKWNEYSHRQQKRAFYKETAKTLGLLENPKEVIFWEGDENTGKWVTGEQLCNEGMITLYKGQGKGAVKE